MSAAPVRHVILVVFDTLRKDALGCYGAPAPWGAIRTPNLDAFARDAVMFTRAYPESLPTLCARRAIYTGQRTFPFHNGDFKPSRSDFVGFLAGWGPIPEEQHTLSEVFTDQGFRTGLVSDLYHQFKPGKNFWRGFEQWSFIRGQEADHSRSGPMPTQEEVDRWIPRQFQQLHETVLQYGGKQYTSRWFDSHALRNMRDRVREELWFNAQVMQEAARWVEQNHRGERLFLTVECFDPHEPWFVPEHYRRRYDPHDGPEQVISPYAEIPDLSPDLLRRTRGNYAGLVEMCDRWFGHLMETLRVTGVLDDALVVVTSDHGHSLWERRGFIGKRAYPSEPEVLDLPLLVRYPGARGAGTRCDAWVQAHDIAATAFEAAGLMPPQPIDGRSFFGAPFGGSAPAREHVTVGFGSAMTVIDEHWWFNCKVNGRGPLLWPAARDRAADLSVADEHADVARSMFRKGLADAAGGFPDFLLQRAGYWLDAPGCGSFNAADAPAA